MAATERKKDPASPSTQLRYAAHSGQTSSGFKSLPKRLIAIDADKQPHYYKVKVALDGSFRVVPVSSFRVASGTYMLALHPEILFHRDGRFFPKDKSDVESAATDLFPFDADHTLYAAYKENSKTVFYALPAELFNTLSSAYPNFSSIIVGKPNSDTLRERLQARIENGPISDFMRVAPRYINPAISVLVKLMVLILVILMGLRLFSLVYSEHFQAQKLDELKSLEQELGPVATKYQTISLMQNSLVAFSDFADPQYVATFERLFTVLNRVPPDVIIDGIEFEPGKFSVSGLDNNARRWLGKNGLDADNIEVIDLPKVDKFKATFQIK